MACKLLKVIWLLYFFYLASSCAAPMVYVNCSTAPPGTTGVECHKSCGNLDMPPCVCIYKHTYTEHVHAIDFIGTYSVCSSCVFYSLLLGWVQISSGCMSGCICPDGLVSNGAGGCIKEASCPCVHSGQVYQPGATLTVDCNTWCVHILSYTHTHTHSANIVVEWQLCDGKKVLGLTFPMWISS